jgi:hypothetical protein
MAPGRVVSSTGRDSRTPPRIPRIPPDRIVGKVGRRPHSVDASTNASNASDVDDARGGRERGERREAGKT